eukprot:COSAG02_NODE_2402_length_8943_cov_2.854138_14_plen_109_part_00
MPALHTTTRPGITAYVHAHTGHVNRAAERVKNDRTYGCRSVNTVPLRVAMRAGGGLAQYRRPWRPRSAAHGNDASHRVVCQVLQLGLPGSAQIESHHLKTRVECFTAN